MKGSEKIIGLLNELLADELTAINQYIVHAEMCSNWDYERLHKSVEKRAIDEMKHAVKLIARILFLEGMPSVSNLNKIHIGADVEKQLNNDHDAEESAIISYRAAIKACFELGDHGTREMLEDILEDEENHIDHIEAQLDQVSHMGVGTFLSEQIEK
ncbi:MAG: bacterioferritin [Nitrospirae bacterium]|nr:bacterioferritin [Nitrospirota bacterium]